MHVVQLSLKGTHSTQDEESNIICMFHIGNAAARQDEVINIWQRAKIREIVGEEPQRSSISSKNAPQGPERHCTIYSFLAGLLDSILHPLVYHAQPIHQGAPSPPDEELDPECREVCGRKGIHKVNKGDIQRELECPSTVNSTAQNERATICVVPLMEAILGVRQNILCRHPLTKPVKNIRTAANTELQGLPNLRSTRSIMNFSRQHSNAIRR